MYVQKELVEMYPVMVPFFTSTPKATSVSPSPTSGPAPYAQKVSVCGQIHLPVQHAARVGPTAVHAGGGVQFVGRSLGNRPAYLDHHLTGTGVVAPEVIQKGRAHAENGGDDAVTQAVHIRCTSSPRAWLHG